MASLNGFISGNRPGAKPELWGNLRGVVQRRVMAWLNDRLDSGWANRPFIATIEPEQLLLEVIPGEVIGKPIVYFGVYEYAVSRLMRAFLRNGDLFVDVGANIGYYSVLAAHLVGCTGRVYAFEPSERIRSRLNRNISLNRLCQVEVRAQAVGRSSGTVRLVEPVGSINDGIAYVDTTGVGNGTEVDAVRLDDIDALRVRPPTLLKVDVEGGEPDVFAGAARMLSDPDGPSVFFESFDLPRDAQTLRGFGYAIYQPVLYEGALRLTSDLQAPNYRAWEAPNFVAVKGSRGTSFANSLSR
jgi:FkbM family methyltransferase